MTISEFERRGTLDLLDCDRLCSTVRAGHGPSPGHRGVGWGGAETNNRRLCGASFCLLFLSPLPRPCPPPHKSPAHPNTHTHTAPCPQACPGVRLAVEADPRLYMWRKLAGMAAYSTVCAAARCPVGPIVAIPEAKATLRVCMEETAAVARACGSNLTPQDVARCRHTFRLVSLFLPSAAATRGVSAVSVRSWDPPQQDLIFDTICSLPPDNTPSMWRDFAAGRPSELYEQVGLLPSHAPVCYSRWHPRTHLHCHTRNQSIVVAVVDSSARPARPSAAGRGGGPPGEAARGGRAGAHGTDLAAQAAGAPPTHAAAAPPAADFFCRYFPLLLPALDVRSSWRQVFA